MKLMSYFMDWFRAGIQKFFFIQIFFKIENLHKNEPVDHE